MGHRSRRQPIREVSLSQDSPASCPVPGSHRIGTQTQAVAFPCCDTLLESNTHPVLVGQEFVHSQVRCVGLEPKPGSCHRWEHSPSRNGLSNSTGALCSVGSVRSHGSSSLGQAQVTFRSNVLTWSPFVDGTLESSESLVFPAAFLLGPGGHPDLLAPEEAQQSRATGGH